MSHLSSKCSFTACFAALVLAGCAPHGKVRSEARVLYAEIPEEAYAVVAEVRAKPGKEDELRAATLPLVAEVRGEPHNRLYFLHEDRENPGHFVFYEIFRSSKDFESHNTTPHVERWFARLPELADGNVRVTRLKILANGARE